MAETLEEEKKLKSFLAKAVRPWKGAYEDILAHHLFISVGAEPLRSIQLIVKAALMFPAEELRRLEIDPELVDVLNVVSSSLANKIVERDDYHQETWVEIPWGFAFTEENIKKYIFVWLSLESFKVKDLTEIFERHKKKFGCEPDLPAKLRYISSCLTPAGYYQILSNFLRWALPKAQEILAKLASALPSAKYTQLLEAAFSTQKQQEKQGKGEGFL